MINDLGVQSGSVRYFQEPDAFTEENLFYISRAGDYRCDSLYRFSREASETAACQLMYIRGGALELHYQGQVLHVEAGRIALIHLGEPHMYRTSGDHLQMQWMQLEGRGCLPYIQLIEKTWGICPPASISERAVEHINHIFKMLREGSEKPGVPRERDGKSGLQEKRDGNRTGDHTAAADVSPLLQIPGPETNVNLKGNNPHSISVCVHQILALLAASSGERERPVSDLEKNIRLSAAYMEKNYADRDLSVERLAGLSAMSVSYYLRTFRTYYRKTPHRYLMDLRIHFARVLLDTTSVPIEDVAEQCGFCSASHLISVFRKETGMTPLQFRNLWR